MTFRTIVFLCSPFLRSVLPSFLPAGRHERFVSFRFFFFGDLVFQENPPRLPRARFYQAIKPKLYLFGFLSTPTSSDGHQGTRADARLDSCGRWLVAFSSIRAEQGTSMDQGNTNRLSCKPSPRHQPMEPEPKFSQQGGFAGTSGDTTPRILDDFNLRRVKHLSSSRQRLRHSPHPDRETGGESHENRAKIACFARLLHQRQPLTSHQPLISGVRTTRRDACMRRLRRASHGRPRDERRECSCAS